ncbi:ABC transporter permease [uncultured Demequina sp.]|uniref:ABC transporter permease n=1 Tax=uncultured Demequina sp. TaxID=693499 RepID=UPI0025E505F4|nr:ABC transporter permease [uncultured Demequina sp.]
MLTFLARRALMSVIPLAGVFIGVFVLARLSGDPSALYLPVTASEETRAEFSARQGFDEPVLAQLGTYLAGVFRGDLGTSLRTGEDALDMVLRAFPVTLALASVAMVLAVALAVLIGSYAALRPNSLMDRLSSLISLAAASLPDFWVALMGIWVFAITLGWLPTSGTAGVIAWVLPVATLLLRPLGVLVQFVRGAMVTAMSEPYIKLARSKGATERRVVMSHALRNAAAPALTVAGDLAVGLINGAVVIETIFGFPGVGKLMIDSIIGREFAVLQAAVLVTSVAIFALNIVIDAAYAMLDPRVRTAGKAVSA